MRTRLERIVKRRKVGSIVAVLAAQRPRDEGICHGGVFGQQRPVAVGTHHVAIAQTLCAVFSVVAKAGVHMPQRRERIVQEGLAAVVLKAHHLRRALYDICGKEQVADHALLRAHGVEGYRADELALLAGMGEVVLAQKLVAAADSKHHGVVFYSARKLGGF